MIRRSLIALAALVALAGPAAAAGVQKAPPPAPYQQVSKLVKLPDFLPGLGTLYVDPKLAGAGVVVEGRALLDDGDRVVSQAGRE